MGQVEVGRDIGGSPEHPPGPALSPPFGPSAVAAIAEGIAAGTAAPADGHRGIRLELQPVGHPPRAQMGAITEHPMAAAAAAAEGMHASSELHDSGAGAGLGFGFGWSFGGVHAIWALMGTEQGEKGWETAKLRAFGKKVPSTPGGERTFHTSPPLGVQDGTPVAAGPVTPWTSRRNRSSSRCIVLTTSS
mgnify:CR=1 FL=1